MLITKLLGLYFDYEYGTTKQKPPAPCVLVEFNFRKKNHRLARDSEHTRLIKRVSGYSRSGKYFTPTFEYYTDTPEIVEIIKENGELTNTALFILEK